MITALSILLVCLYIFGIYLVAELMVTCRLLKEVCGRMEKLSEDGLALRYDIGCDLAGGEDLYIDPDTGRLRTAENVDTCVSCGAIVPEGRQICPKCEKEF